MVAQHLAAATAVAAGIPSASNGGIDVRPVMVIPADAPWGSDHGLADVEAVARRA